MLLLAALSVLAAGAEPTLTGRQLQTMAPMEIARAALAGRDHGPIVRVEKERDLHNPPGEHHYKVYEAAEAVPGGCRRRVWWVTFSARRDDPDGPARLMTPTPTTQVALEQDGSCEDASFAHLNPGLEEEQGFALLRRVRQAVEGGPGIRFDCRSEIDPAFCADPQTIRAALRASRLGTISRPMSSMSPQDGVIEAWFGTGRGQQITVRFDEAEPDQIYVEKKIPAPF